MSVWTDVVGQERAVAALDAAARSARALVRARRAGSAAGSGAGPDAAAEFDVGSGVAGPDAGGAGTAQSGTGAAGPGTGSASTGAEPGQEPDADASAMTHAWLITGPPGSGRSVAARAFAAALQCTGKVPNCGRYKPCHDVLAGSHPDVVRLATDKLLITMDEVKELIDQAQRRPWTGSWRVILVEDADRMAERTTNVLLKSIEEPPPQTVWLLYTPSTDDVLPIIRSQYHLVTLRIPPPPPFSRCRCPGLPADPYYHVS